MSAYARLTSNDGLSALDTGAPNYRVRVDASGTSADTNIQVGGVPVSAYSAASGSTNLGAYATNTWDSSSATLPAANFVKTISRLHAHYVTGGAVSMADINSLPFGFTLCEPHNPAGSQVQISAGGNVNDDVAGSGARSITISGLRVGDGELVSETINTAGASASFPTSNSYYVILAASVYSSGTAGAANAGNIELEWVGGTYATDPCCGVILADYGQTLCNYFVCRPAVTAAVLKRFTISTNAEITLTLLAGNQRVWSEIDSTPNQIVTRSSWLIPAGTSTIEPCIEVVRQTADYSKSPAYFRMLVSTPLAGAELSLDMAVESF